MEWRLAYSLDQLRSEVNAKYPKRSKVSDGTIGDSAHASTWSDHNPNAQGVVCAFDITHDPANGLDAHALANYLIANRHPNLKYIISNGRIAGEWTGWKWQAYNGSNPHDKHIHISVGKGEDGRSTPPYDDRTKWLTINTGVDMLTREEAIVMYMLAVPGQPVNNVWVTAYTGKPTGQALNALVNDPSIKAYRDKLVAGGTTRESALKYINNNLK